jgi:hypothetical protein
VQLATVRPRNRVDVLTAIGLGLYLVLIAVYVDVRGVPHSADDLFLLLAVGLLLVSLRGLKTWARGVVVDWLPFFGVLMAYDLLRGYANHLITAPHVTPQIRFDEILFGGVVPTVRLQRALYSPTHLHWWDYAVWLVHISHFFTAFVVAAVLWKRAYSRFRRFAAMFLTLTVAGFVTYVLFPAVPPWLASTTGHLQHTTRIVEVVWGHVGVRPAVAVFENGSRYVNDVAAIPSLHAAYPMLLLLFFWRSRWWVRALLVAYVLAMTFAIVYSAEHYMADVVIGWAYAAIAVFVVGRAQSSSVRTRTSASQDS